MVFDLINLVYAVQSTVWGLAILVLALILFGVMVLSIAVFALKHSNIPEDVWRR